MPYQPPLTITPTILNLVAHISEQVGRLSVLSTHADLRLRRIARIRTIQGSLAIEGNTLSEAQITAILNGKPVIAPQRELHPLIRSAVFHYEFEFIHPFSDGNGRLGRLWQSKILAQWHPLFANMPVETIVFAHQADYYAAIAQSTAQTDNAPFVEFMLGMIRDTLEAHATPQVSPQDTPQVKEIIKRFDGLLAFCLEQKSRQALQSFCQLTDREHFRKHVLRPLLESGILSLTLPDKPNSPKQHYVLSEVGKALL